MALISINKDPTRSQLRQFACLFLPAFCAIAGYFLYVRSGQIAWPGVIWGIAVVSAMTGWIAPKLIEPVFVGSMYLTFPIGWVVSHVLLLIAFYLVISPIGLIMRLCGYDPMHRNFDRAAKSYWTARKSNPDHKSYFRQY